MSNSLAFWNTSHKKQTLNDNRLRAISCPATVIFQIQELSSAGIKQTTVTKL